MAKTTTRYVVTFKDGREEGGKTLPIHTRMAEKHLGKLNETPLEGVHYTIYLSLRDNGKLPEEMTFDAFWEALADVDVDPDEAEGNGAGPYGGPQSPPSPTAHASPPATSTPT